MKVLFTTILLSIALAACGGGSDEPEQDRRACAPEAMERVAIAQGDGGVQLIRAIELPATVSDRVVNVTLQADRTLSTASGVHRGPPGATASFHFVRVYLGGSFSENRNVVDEMSLPIAAGTCARLLQTATLQVAVPAGSALRIESVWSIVRPAAGDDLEAITTSFSLQAH